LSYCVNCGVELCDTERSCPLCGVTVNNPKKPYDETIKKPYPSNIEADIKNINLKFGGWLAFFILLIPSAVTTICDVLITHGLSWSLYVTGASLCIYVWFILPLILRNRSPYQFIVFDCIASLLYILLIAYETDGLGWYNGLAMPITVSVYIFILGLTAIFRVKSIFRLTKASAFFFLSGVLTLIIDIIVTLFITKGFGATWSLISLCVCSLFGGICLLFRKHAILREELKKRLFI